MKDILIQLKGKCEFEFERDVQSFYDDWNYPNNTGMITVVFERDITTGINQEPSHEFNRLIDEVTQISIIVQKKTEKTEVYQISPKVYLVRREGILVQIEKALIKRIRTDINGNKGYFREVLFSSR